MTCKDCIHEKVCDNLIAQGLPWEDGKYPAEIWCDHFKNKADVVEVRHGYWYFVEYEYFSCSECGESYYNGCEYTAKAKENLQNGDYYKYCPHCGAKMGGERREE